VSVLALRRGGPFVQWLRDAGVTVHVADVRSRFDLLGYLRAFALASPAPDVVLSQSLNAQILGRLIARRGRAVHVTIEHGGPGLGFARHQRWLMRSLAGHYDAVVAVSASQLPELAELGYPLEGVRVIPYGVPEPVAERSRSDVRAGLGLAEGDFVVILVAGLRPEKRVDLFLDAVAAAHARDDRVRGVIAGGGALLEQVQRHAAPRGAVLVLGERADVPDLVAAADVVCLTSRTEALPLAIIEAMALGRPVVATAVGGVPGVVADRQTGILVEDAEPGAIAAALSELASAPERARAYGRAGRSRYLAGYTVDRVADAYAALITELLDRRHRRP
jgi:glycosyltransferase involved in cell wall biosynthesis